MAQSIRYNLTLVGKEVEVVWPDVVVTEGTLRSYLRLMC
jgi:hypothetical protein